MSPQSLSCATCRNNTKKRFVELDGKTKMLVNGKLSDYIPNPTFEVVAAPGSTVEYLKGNNPDGKSYRDFMQPQKCIPEYRVKTPKRYELLEEHGLCGTLMFPTLASVVEGHMYEDPDLCHAMIHSLNQWMLDEWGFRGDALDPSPDEGVQDQIADHGDLNCREPRQGGFETLGRWNHADPLWISLDKTSILDLALRNSTEHRLDLALAHRTRPEHVPAAALT